MKFLTAWHQVPVLGCIRGLCENCVDIVSKKLLISAVTFDDTVYVLGFRKEDIDNERYDNFKLLSCVGFDTYDTALAVGHFLKEQSTTFNIFLPVDTERNTIICSEFDEFLKETILDWYLKGYLIERED